MTLPEFLTNWKMILMLVFGIVSIGNGIRIWIRKVMQVADPFLWVPLTGGLGGFIIRFLYDDEEIRGIPARIAALFQVGYGFLLLSVFFFVGVWPACFAKAPKPVTPPEPAQEMAYLPAQESGPPASMPPPNTPPVAVAEAAPATPPVPSQTPPPPAPAPAPEKPGTIQRMSKGWMPEGIQRR